MTRMPAWAILVLAAAVALTIAVAAAMAADQPAAVAPQEFHWVADLVVFTPRDASTVRDVPAPDAYPHWLAPYVTPGVKSDFRSPDGYWVRRPIEELAPNLASFDGLTSREPALVEQALARMDDRFEYHVLTLSGQGKQGDMFARYGRLGPIRLRTPEGADLGKNEALFYRAVSVARPDRVLGGNYAVVQFSNSFECGPAGAAVSEQACAGGVARQAGEMKLGSCVAGGAMASQVEQLAAANGGARDYVMPGYAWLRTADLGPWKTGG